MRVRDRRARGAALVHEHLNVRDLGLAHVDHRPVDLLVGDLSFISLIVVLPALVRVVDGSGSLLLMVKPQFEVGRDRLGDGGVVRSPALHAEAVAGVIAAAAELGWHAHAVIPSRLPGPSGNREFFVLLTTEIPVTPVDVAASVALEAPQHFSTHRDLRDRSSQIRRRSKCSRSGRRGDGSSARCDLTCGAEATIRLCPGTHQAIR